MEIFTCLDKARDKIIIDRRGVLRPNDRRLVYIELTNGGCICAAIEASRRVVMSNMHWLLRTKILNDDLCELFDSIRVKSSGASPDRIESAYGVVFARYLDESLDDRPSFFRDQPTDRSPETFVVMGIARLALEMIRNEIGCIAYVGDTGIVDVGDRGEQDFWEADSNGYIDGALFLRRIGVREMMMFWLSWIEDIEMRCREMHAGNV